MKLATRSAAAAPYRREPRFLDAHGQVAGDPYGRALIRVSFTRVSARFAWPSADLLEGGGTGPKRPGPERGTTG
ncbi:MAG: hypothetical protein WB499_07120, partial [Pseudolabrys sp.]